MTKVARLFERRSEEEQYLCVLRQVAMPEAQAEVARMREEGRAGFDALTMPAGRHVALIAWWCCYGPGGKSTGYHALWSPLRVLDFPEGDAPYGAKRAASSTLGVDGVLIDSKFVAANEIVLLYPHPFEEIPRRFQEVFADRPAVLEHAARSFYDEVACVRLMYRQKKMTDDLTIRRILRESDGIIDRIREAGKLPLRLTFHEPILEPM